jgi:uncharacterized protein YjiS (DUF1127 family)
MFIALAMIARPEIRKWASPFFRSFTGFMDDVAHYFSRRAAIKTLRELDDRALWDIGLLRCQIEDAVHGFTTDPDRGRL